MTLNKKFNVPTTRDLMISLPRIRREWKWMSPIQMWCYLFGIGKFGFGTIKFPIFSKNVKEMHLLSYYCWSYTVTFYLLMLYTFYYYLSRGDSYSCLPCTCMAGVLGAVCIVYIARQLVHLDLFVYFTYCITNQKRHFSRLY